MAAGSKKDPPGRSAPDVRFEATVSQGDRDVALARVADLDLDRVPDPHGDVRLLVAPEELTALLDEGFEVHLYRAVRPEPLPKDLVAEDDATRRWLEERVQGIPRETGPAEADS